MMVKKVANGPAKEGFHKNISLQSALSSGSPDKNQAVYYHDYCDYSST